MRRSARMRPRRERGTRIFFATDIHGSEVCFKKFLNAAAFYDVSHLIMGGDMTGKMLIPITRSTDGRYACAYGDEAYRDLDMDALSELQEAMRRSGHYPVIGTAEELSELDDPAVADATFRKIVCESVRQWVELADARLRGTGVRCYISPANDDFMEIDDILKASETIEFSDDRCIDLDGRHEMITVGWSNPTPWKTERELPEDELLARMSALAAQSRDPENLIAVLHVPPYMSGLDDAPALTDDLEMRLGAGGLAMLSAGSTATRKFIENVQPLASLHGHIHEGRGSMRIGRTLCVNPGSEYTEGILTGAILELGDGEVISHQLVAG
jgi:Icc-related predicted phosphoesterase